MYHHFSRLLYRQLASLLRDDPRQGGMRAQRQRLLDACEMTMKRLATDPDYFANPEKYLFSEVRPLFTIGDQLQVRLIIDLEMGIFKVALARQRELERQDCAAFTRSGDPCRREPLPGGRYCPSHRHLAESDHPPLIEAPV
jgi:hypothetical protein